MIEIEHDELAADLAIVDTISKLREVLETHEIISVSISGGSDSDIIIHLLSKFPQYQHKLHYVFCNTGLEYRATLRHLDYLEKKYGISIKRLTYKDGVTPIPLAVHKYGLPFLSKINSEYLARLQSHQFKYEDLSFQELYKIYPTSKSPLIWWCNEGGGHSLFNINRNRGLKEFLIAKQPSMKISAKCCDVSKKNPMKRFCHKIKADLTITGERKIEGGFRAAKQSCFGTWHGIDKFMPLFFWSDDTKSFYKERENIVYSDCYEVYGLRRTGCVGCPFALKRDEELEVLKKYEPNLYKAVVKVFEESYLLTDEYHEFQKEIKNKS